MLVDIWSIAVLYIVCENAVPSVLITQGGSVVQFWVKIQDILVKNNAYK